MRLRRLTPRQLQVKSCCSFMLRIMYLYETHQNTVVLTDRECDFHKVIFAFFHSHFEQGIIEVMMFITLKH